ncbi:MAG: anti-sigma factor [Candidatus Dormibacteraeota bacterium]|nr:anti-sigma factor [Candidatus Dormibacteraeota bacterium]
MSEHEELEASVAAWVLGAMDADEADAMRVHIEACPSCREAATRLRRAVGSLPLAAEEVAPPVRLRERVLSAAAVSRGSVAPPARAKEREPWRPSRVVPPAKAPRRPISIYAAAAAVLLALLVGVVAGDLVGRGMVRPPSSTVARFTVVGHQDLGGAKATVIDLRSDGVALLDFTGLPSLQPGKVYEVWLITAGGRADPAAVFVPDSNGGKVVLINQSLNGYSQMAITREVGPEGSKVPSEQPQMYGTLA